MLDKHVAHLFRGSVLLRISICIISICIYVHVSRMAMSTHISMDTFDPCTTCLEPVMVVCSKECLYNLVVLLPVVCSNICCC